MRKMDIIHPMRRFRCFVFDNPQSLRSSNKSKPKRTVTPYYVYVCPTSARRGFRCEYRHCKGKVFFDKVSCFNKKNLGKNSCRTLSKSRSVLLCNIVELHRISLRKHAQLKQLFFQTKIPPKNQTQSVDNLTHPRLEVPG